MALYASILTGGTNNHTTTSEEANYLATDFVSNGIIGNYTNTSSVAPMTGAFACNAQGTPDMTIAVTSGACYVTATPSGQNSQQFRVKLSANENATISANSSGSTKYDWVYVAIDATNAANPNLAGDDVATITISRSSSNSTDNGTPPTYGYLIAVVTVANGASSITNGNIRDTRAKSEITANSSSVTTGWVTGMAVPTSTVANGNRSYTNTYASSIASTVSPGMRRRFTRTVAGPTTAFSLDGSNDYYVKTSPSGMTFTDDFVVSAWVYMTSYAQSIIASRNNGTSGWNWDITNTGQIRLAGYNGALTNTRYITSYQSIPLNKWVHVAAQLDMSTYTVSTTTCYVMINGKDVPAFLTQNGTNPTALVQAGNLEIGSYNGGTSPFPGYIDQVAIYSAKVTQATILASMNQALTGSETSLISAYSNGSVTDLSANANNLTATNGATTVSSSWHGNRGISSTLEYALTMSVSSDGLTEVVQVPEGCALPTTGGITASAYSTMANPYGYKDPGNILSYIEIRSTQTFTTIAQILGLSASVYVPTGRSVKVSAMIGRSSNPAISTVSYTLWDGTVGSGTQLVLNYTLHAIAGNSLAAYLEAVVTPSTNSKTYNLGGAVDTNTETVQASATNPVWIKVELVPQA